MRVAYLTNRYPAVSHSFIRREILALESLGLRIDRFAIRRDESPLVDPLDRSEAANTRYLLDTPLWGLLTALVLTAARSPMRFCRAVASTIRMGWGSRSGLPRHFAYLAEASVLLRLLRKSRVDHLHVHFGTNATTVALLTRCLGGPDYSFTVHGPEEFDDAARISLPRKIRQSRFVVAISSFGRSQLYRHCERMDWPRIHVVRCGLPDDYGEDDHEIEMHDRRLVCVGRLCEQKGQQLLIQAANQLRQSETPVELVLVGDGPMRADVESLIQDLEMQDCVQLTGSLSGDDVKGQILSARALVLPSFAEGLPVVIMESLALGRPVITTYVSGIPELVDHQCGWIIPAGSVSALADAMRDALQRDPEDLLEMGERGRDRIDEFHRVTRESEKLAALFEGRTVVAERSTKGELVSGLPIT